MGDYNSPTHVSDRIISNDDEIQIVEFCLEKELFAVNLFDVKEIVEYTKITPLPNSQRYIKGIIDLRGEITTIIDLKEKMGLFSSETILDQSRIIVIDNSVTKSKTGILVDDVTTVLSVKKTQIDENSYNNEKSDSYILGIIRHNRGDKDSDNTDLIIWLDIPRMLRDMGQ